MAGLSAVSSGAASYAPPPPPDEDDDVTDTAAPAAASANEPEEQASNDPPPLPSPPQGGMQVAQAGARPVTEQHRVPITESTGYSTRAGAQAELNRQIQAYVNGLT